MSDNRWSVRGVPEAVQQAVVVEAKRRGLSVGAAVSQALDRWLAVPSDVSDVSDKTLAERVAALEDLVSQLTVARPAAPLLLVRSGAATGAVGGSRQAYSAEVVARIRDLQADYGWGKRRIAAQLVAEGHQVTENGVTKYLRAVTEG